jgi:hypothetical protein
MKLALAFLFLLPSSGFSAVPNLDPRERDALRSRLEAHFSELDLTVKNHRSEVRDLERQKLEIEQLKVLERIPFEEKIPELKKELAESASSFRVKVSGFQKKGHSSIGTRPVPDKIFSDERFRLDPTLTAQEVHFTLTADGDRAAVQKWLASLPTEQMRLVELKKLEPLNNRQFIVRAHAFRFRPIEFPKIEVRDPSVHLPGWAKKNPQAFAESEPLLWSFVTQARELKAQAEPLYATRRQVLLNSARMAFFLSKALPKPPYRH